MYGYPKKELKRNVRGKSLSVSRPAISKPVASTTRYAALESCHHSLSNTPVHNVTLVPMGALVFFLPGMETVSTQIRMSAQRPASNRILSKPGNPVGPHIL